MKKVIVDGLILCLGFIMMISIPNTCYAVKYLNVSAQVKNKTKVEITWKKKAVTGYDIYRATSNKNGENGKYKKIATVSGSKTKYIDKKARYKKYYSYMIKAYKKKNGNKVTKYRGYVDVYTGMAKPDWDDYLYADAQTTPNSIQLIGYTDGLRPDGFEIYRKTGISKYRKIKTLKTKKGYFTYVDTNVHKGKKYTYKYRAYRTIKGETIYSKYSDKITLCAINQEAEYDMQILTNDGKVKAITIGLTSKNGNGTTILEDNVNHITYYHHKSGCDADYVDLMVVSYSYDNKTWFDFPTDGISIRENETVYVQLASMDGKMFQFATMDVFASELEWWLRYNDKHSILWVDFLKQTASARVNGEYYH